MTAYLQRVFRVLPEESGKLTAFAALAALLQAGVAVGMTASDSLFLTHLGAEKLPIVFLCMPVVMAVYAPVYTWLLARLGMDRLIYLTLGLLMVGGAFFGVSDRLFGAAQPWLLFAMKFYSGLWFIALYTVYWNFADDYFSILDGKRLYGLIAAGGAAGAMLGATLVTGLSRFVATERLFFAWSALALLTVPLVVVLRRFPRVEIAEIEEDSPRSPWQLLRFALGTFKHSRFALGLAAACFCAVNLAAVLEYLSMGVFAAGKNPAELAQLLGPLYAIANLFTLLANLFVFNRLVGRIGVGNTTLVLPLAFLAAFAALFLHHGFAAAILAFYAYQSLLASIEYNNVNLLFNAMPAATKRPLRTFVEAMSEPAATALAGLFLLGWSTQLGSIYIALAGVFASLAAVGIALFLRTHYTVALTSSLRRDWLDFSPPPEHWRDRLSERDRALLREKARHSPDRGERITATDLLGYTADPEAGTALTELVGSARASEAELLRPAISRILRGEDTAALARVLLWLESDASPEDPELLDEFAAHGALPVRHLRAWRHSRHPARVAGSAVARWRGARVEDTAEALAEVQNLLNGDPAARRWGVRALGGLRHAPHARTLLPFLDEADAELRLETLRALHQLAGPDTDVVLPRVLPMLADGSPDERQLILGIAANIGSVSSLDVLLQAARHFSVAEGRQLESLIVGLGPRAIATVIHLLRNPTTSSHSRTIAARALARLARPQLDLIADDLMLTELSRARELAQTATLLGAEADERDSDGIAVLRRYYHDSATDGLHFVLQLLGLTERLPDVDLIQASLTFANAKDRANAIETIEQSCPRELFDQLRPLLSPGDPASWQQRAAAETGLSRETLLRRASASEDPLECSAALLAFAELKFPGARELLRQRIDRSEPGRLTATLGALLARLEPALQGASPHELLPVERVAVLVRATPFDDAPIAALDYLAARCVEETIPADKTLYSPQLPTGDLLIVAQGAVEVAGLHGTTPLGRGGVSNLRALMGTIAWQESAQSRGSILLRLSGAVIARAVEIYPSLGLSLYRTKLNPAAP